jgi:hypothetical protein
MSARFLALCAVAGASLGTVVLAQGPTSSTGIRPGRWVYSAHAEYRGERQDLGARTITVTTQATDEGGTWLVVAAMTIDGKPVIDSVAMRVKDLRPVFRHAQMGPARIDLTAPDTMVHGLLTVQTSIVPINVPLGKRSFLNYYALRVALADWPLTSGWTGEASALELGGEATFAPLKLSVTGDEQVEVPAGRFNCWRVAVKGPGIDEQYWVSKEGHQVVRTREPLSSEGMVLQLDLTAQVSTP